MKFYRDRSEKHHHCRAQQSLIRWRRRRRGIGSNASSFRQVIEKIREDLSLFVTFEKYIRRCLWHIYHFLLRLHRLAWVHVFFHISSYLVRARASCSCSLFFPLFSLRSKSGRRKRVTNTDRERERTREEETETETIFFSCLLLVYYNIDVRSSLLDDNENGLHLKRLPQCQSYQVDLRASHRRKSNRVSRKTRFCRILSIITTLETFFWAEWLALKMNKTLNQQIMQSILR